MKRKDALKYIKNTTDTIKEMGFCPECLTAETHSDDMSNRDHALNSLGFIEGIKLAFDIE